MKHFKALPDEDGGAAENHFVSLLEKRRKNLIISLIVLPIYTIALEAYLLSLLYVPGPSPPSLNPILISAFITAIVCAPMIFLVLAFAWALFTIEKMTGEAIKIEKYIVVFLVLFLLPFSLQFTLTMLSNSAQHLSTTVNYRVE